MNWEQLTGRRIHIIGVKGSGCAALAEILHSQGAILSGSDNPPNFYTSAILDALGFPIYHTFAEEHITPELDVVIYSAAYETGNIELDYARQIGILTFSYPQALGELSKSRFSIAVAGVHGKTTTTALLGSIVKDQGWLATTLVGSRVANFGNTSTSITGNDIFIAETCEYREHFLEFFPNMILLTSVEWDHQDFYSEIDMIEQAFVRFIQKLPANGTLLYNADCAGVQRVIAKIRDSHQDIHLYSIGRQEHVDFQISEEVILNEYNTFRLTGLHSPVPLPMIGQHNVMNAAMAITMASLLAKEHKLQWSEDDAILTISRFLGLARRLERIGLHPTRDILILDDYAHHPSAIKTTLLGLKEFYPHRRLIVSFMSHTYSRTASLFTEFVDSLLFADVLILHKIYGSAREQANDTMTGYDLYEAVRKKKLDMVFYQENPIESLPLIKSLVQDGDIILTMGAGDNFLLSHTLREELWTDV
ncbi:UDP-N-acetylmuramate--L-alanine ligase [Entomospira entomophila]|nr:UDP-N-acetylmuramate--L-alanine ligase [Entomospira entomophilus]WDI36150.1 UDP-N-acetylmuramate--L-alanine ligase [Entomospira entomophilus]